ncbi:MAG: hypothetical protein AB8H47_21505 [Bacteroidia bacterium]
MKSQSKNRLLQLPRQELIRLCNEKLVLAARDLAEFTQNGLNASFIVALAHKCEHFEQDLQHPSQAINLYNQRESKRIEKEIMEGLTYICDLGRRIWSKNPNKRDDYAISVTKSGRFAESGSANVA